MFIFFKYKFNFNQKTLKFVHESNYDEGNLVKSSCNNIAINFIEKWTNWSLDNRIVCIFWEAGSGKTNIARVWKKKSNAKIFNKISNLTLNNIYEINTTNTNNFYSWNKAFLDRIKLCSLFFCHEFKLK